ncbi:hypothetical protein IJG79_03045 [Candidatus Saccharibacteria bacterium]|nr:hypothetical protein [Candidatus Saccharibacteria bacterium]
MEKDISSEKPTKISNLAEDAQQSASHSYETENQLSNNLITITLAFVALLATAISTSNVLATISILQKILIMSSIVIFCLSIFVGLLNYYLNMRFHQKNAKSNRKKAQAVNNSDSKAELNRIKRTITRPEQSTARNNVMILAQILLLGIGLILCVAFIAMMLFVTSESI